MMTSSPGTLEKRDFGWNSRAASQNMIHTLQKVDPVSKKVDPSGQIERESLESDSLLGMSMVSDCGGTGSGSLSQWQGNQSEDRRFIRVVHRWIMSIESDNDQS
jgi:hypothetical protein